MLTSKTMTNLQVAKLLRAVAAALSLSKGDNRFRIVAYERAADAIEHSTSEVKDLWDEGRLGDLAGVGESLAAHLDELFRTGRVQHFSTILRPIPPAVFELMDIPGVGPKTAYRLAKSLGISKAHGSVEKLEKAALKGHIRPLEGFGKQSEADIIQGIKELKGRSTRMLLPVAADIADSVIAWLKASPHVLRADPLGSLRRQVATVGDVDLSAASADPQAVIDHFTGYPKATRVLEAGVHSASLVLPNDRQVDLIVQPPATYGSLLQHFTGSKHHNIALRELALKKGLSLSEYGIKDAKTTHQFATEDKFYEFLGLQWIPPEMREAAGEIELAKNHRLPRLVELEDIRGDLQIHSDIDIETSHDLGTSSLSELAVAAHRLGYEYIGVTEHNPSVSRHSSAQVIDLIKRKTERVKAFTGPVHIFNGLEIDIQPDGRRALPDAALEILDYACVSIHSSFRAPKSAATARVLSALDHPKVKFFAHPTARLLGEREGVDLDWDAIFDFCLTHHKWLEVDAWPNRLDLPDNLVREAVKKGVKIIIDTDSHSADHMQFMRYGVAVARRGWSQKSDIINTQTLKEVTKLFL